MFRIVKNKGFHIDFSNDVTISVQFGQVNYCSNYMTGHYNGEKPAKSVDAEVAVIDRGGNFVTKSAFKETFGIELDDDVAGHVSADKVAELIVWCVTQD